MAQAEFSAHGCVQEGEGGGGQLLLGLVTTSQLPMMRKLGRVGVFGQGGGVWAGWGCE